MTLTPTQPSTQDTASTTQSEALFVRAQQVIPGGVNSPVRAFRSVGGHPRFIASANGATLTDADGKTYLDYIGSWGPMILGHNHPAVRQAIMDALPSGTSFGAPTEREVLLAELVTRLTGVDKVRFVSSGTEATMSALRLARGYTSAQPNGTGRKYTVKFRGNYHGHADALLVEAGSGLMTNADTLGQAAPSSAGVPAEYAALTLVADYNDAEGLDELMRARGHEIAAVIFEPIVGNAGVLIPRGDFLEALHRVQAAGALLIADEVMTGFRLSIRGATGLLNLKPDLTCWGKIIGGGLPVGAYGGRAEIMDFVSPVGPVYQAGTLSGNPLAMAAGLATLQELERDPAIYERLTRYTAALGQGLRVRAHSAGVPIRVNQAGSMLTAFFLPAGASEETEIGNYGQAAQADTAAFSTWFQSMLSQGIYWAPSQFESIFVSGAHTQADLDRTLDAAETAFAALAASGTGRRA